MSVTKDGLGSCAGESKKKRDEVCTAIELWSWKKARNIWPRNNVGVVVHQVNKVKYSRRGEWGIHLLDQLIKVGNYFCRFTSLFTNQNRFKLKCPIKMATVIRRGISTTQRKIIMERNEVQIENQSFLIQLGSICLSFIFFMAAYLTFRNYFEPF